MGQPDQEPSQAEHRNGPYEGTLPLHRLVINYDHHGSGLGEDAPPIWIFQAPTIGLIGVFDGLGGAGGQVIRLPDGSERTGAWLASRYTRNCVVGAYRDLLQDTVTRQASPGNAVYDYDRATELHELYGSGDFTTELRHVLGQNLTAFATQIGARKGGSRLRSKLIKTLPTTMAICFYNLSSNEFTAIWAGDSRIYSIRPSEGLQQVTTDDLRSNVDALENLTQDSPMSNCISVDTDFVLHERRLALEPPTILIAASDGCFGYVQTPLHFEHALLSTMQEAAGWADWQERLESCIARMTGDDSTLSAVAIGWPDFASCKVLYAPRANWCAQRVSVYDERYDKVQSLGLDLVKARTDLASTTQALWKEYRASYESLTLAPSRQVPPHASPDGNGEHADSGESS